MSGWLPIPAKIEQLRLILEREWQRPVSTAEASELGGMLISFYENLAKNKLAIGYSRKGR